LRLVGGRRGFGGVAPTRNDFELWVTGYFYWLLRKPPSETALVVSMIGAEEEEIMPSTSTAGVSITIEIDGDIAGLTEPDRQTLESRAIDALKAYLDPTVVKPELEVSFEKGTKVTVKT
jgi:hypothetical protein